MQAPTALVPPPGRSSPGPLQASRSREPPYLTFVPPSLHHSSPRLVPRVLEYVQTFSTHCNAPLRSRPDLAPVQSVPRPRPPMDPVPRLPTMQCSTSADKVKTASPSTVYSPTIVTIVHSKYHVLTHRPRSHASPSDNAPQLPRSLRSRLLDTAYRYPCPPR